MQKLGSHPDQGARFGFLAPLQDAWHYSFFLIGLIWYFGFPAYRYHIDESPSPHKLLVHRGQRHGSEVESFVLDFGDHSSEQLASGRSSKEGRGIKQKGNGGEWEPGYERHLWTGRVYATLKLDGKDIPPCDTELARQEECRTELVEVLKTAEYHASYQQVISNMAGGALPQTPVVRTRLLISIYARETKGTGGYETLIIENPSGQGHLQSVGAIQTI